MLEGYDLEDLDELREIQNRLIQDVEVLEGMIVRLEGDMGSLAGLAEKLRADEGVLDLADRLGQEELVTYVRRMGREGLLPLAERLRREVALLIRGFMRVRGEDVYDPSPDEDETGDES
ncbi:MAG: hypothetical protein HY720_02095 [Planctomycetes bacterium]|nr:hypothetical protein [Planctomycetota bacterium]